VSVCVWNHFGQASVRYTVALALAKTSALKRMKNKRLTANL